MTLEELQALIQKATDNYTAIKSTNESLESKARKLEEKHSALMSKYEALEQQIKDGGGNSKEVQALTKTITELQDEISDVRSDVKAPSTAFDTKEVKAAVKNVVMESVGSFLKTKNNQIDFFEYVEDTATERCKTLNISSPETGGLAVAEVLARDVLDYYRTISPILQHIGRKTSMTRNYRQLILISYPGVAEGIEAVAGTVPAETSTQTYAEIKSKEFKLYASPRITNEALYGTDISVYSDLVQLLGEEIGIYLASQVLYGDGTDKNARGILSSNRVDITNLTGESFKPTLGAGSRDHDFYPVYPTGVSADTGTDDVARVNWLLTFMRKLPQRYRANAKLYMNENTLGVYEQIRDADNRPVFRLNYMEGEPRLNGKPVVIDDTLPDIAADSTFIIYGDLAAAYAINDGDIDQMLLDPYTKKGNLIVYTEKEMFEMAQRSDAILIGAATTNGPA